MITVRGADVRAGARVLIESASFRIAKGDRIGLVGRNGAGKTTLTKVLAGEGMPAAGTVTRSGDVGYLPQDPRTGDLDVLARDRILSARGLDTVLRKMRENEDRMSNGKGATREKAMKKYERLETEFLTKGGYAAEAEAATIAASLGLPDRILGQPLHTLSGGQRRRVELARILFSDADTLLLDEPTNHLDADSIAWLRDYLKTYRGGFIVISHDVDLVETVVNKVFYLDANRSQIDIYNMGWKLYQQQREADEKRRKRERANAEKKAAALHSQADKMRAKATKTVAAQNMARARGQAAGRPGGGARLRQGRQAALPGPRAVRQDPADGRGPVQVVRLAGDLHRCRPGHRQGLPGRHPRPERRGQDDAAAAAGGRGEAGHRRGASRARPEAGLLRAGARHARPGPHRPREPAARPRRT
ncbi:putative ABC transporter ATP-binding protein YheS [Streptomyces rimosus subsp. rimosus]